MIKEKLTDLKDTVIDGIKDFVISTIVKAAIPKLVAMFIPGAGFVAALVSIYGTIKSFMEQIGKVAAAVMAFIDSIVAIAAGQIGGAAHKVESALAGVLSIAIGLLAGFLNLGNISAKVMAVVKKVQTAVDKALEKAIAWLIDKAKKAFAWLFGKGDKDGKPDQRTDAQKQADLAKAVADAQAIAKQPKITPARVQKELSSVKGKYKLTSIGLVTDKKESKLETDHIVAEINPILKGDPISFVVGMPQVSVDFDAKSYSQSEYSRQLRMQQTTIRAMKIEQWWSARTTFKAVGRDPRSKALQQAFRDQNRAKWIADKAAELKAQGVAAADLLPEAEKLWGKQAALHPLDQVAGGGPQPTEFGDTNINSSIGASWNSEARIGVLEKAVQLINDPADRTSWNMDVMITLNGSPV
jgi:hypothetical protein